MPPPSLLTTTTTSRRPSRRAASSPPMSCASATSPTRATTGPRAAAATPKAVEIVPSMPLAPRLASTRGAVLAGREERLDVAHRHRGGHDERRRRRQAPAELGRDAGLAEAGRREHARDAGGGRPVAALPALEPVALAAPAAHALAQRLERRPRVRGHDRADGAGGVLPGGLGVERDLQRVAEAVQPRPQGLGRRQVAEAQDELRGVGRRPVAVAQERVVVRDRGRAAAGARQRVREQRQPGPVGERRERRAQGGVALRAPGDDERARVLLELDGEAVEQRRRRRRADPRARDPRTPAGAPAPARLVRGQRRARARAARAGRSSGARGRAAPRARSRRRGRRAARSQRMRSGVAGHSSTSWYHFAARP